MSIRFHGYSSCARGMRAAPFLDALDDEEPLAGQDEAHPPRFPREGLDRCGALEPRLQPASLLAQQLHLGRAVVQRRPRLEVARERLVVEEGDEARRGEHAPPEQHGRPLGARTALRCPLPARAGGSCGTRVGARGSPGHGSRFSGRARAPSYAVSTLITFVEPGMFTAVPAVRTTRSPGSITPVLRAASSEVAQSSSTSAHSGTCTGVTPHSSAMYCRE